MTFLSNLKFNAYFSLLAHQTKLLFFLIVIIVFHSQTLFANCGHSKTFSDWNIQGHSVGADASFTSDNWIDPSIYVHSKGIFEKMYHLIQKAEKHVYIQTWTFQPGTKPTLYLAQAIRQLHETRQKKGLRTPVHFWLMLNIISLQNEDIERQRVQKFIAKQGLNLEGIVFHIGFFKAKLLGANHAKTVSVDNKIALVTGANFSPSNNKNGFFDLAFVLKGDVVKNIDYDFVQIWKSFIDKKDRPTNWGKDVKVGVETCVPILFTRSKPFPDFSKKIQNSSLNDAILDSIRSAKKSIDIITPNMNVTALLNEIAKAALRGVKVKIILSKGFTDLPQMLPTRGGPNTMSINRLHRALRKKMSLQNICENLEIKWYALDGLNAINSTQPPASHAKFMLIDDQISFFGSANMDNQSWVNSREIGLFADKSFIAKKWKNDFFNPTFEQSVTIEKCQ